MTQRQSPFGSASTGIRRLVRREIQARSETIVGTVLSQPQLLDQDGAGSATWVVDVNVGAREVLRNVPVKAGSNGERFYAGLGQTVKLARNTQGRFDVIGPGDRANSIAVRKTYDPATRAEVSSANEGLQTQIVAFEFYQGPTPPTPGTSLWNDGVTPFPLIRIVDGNGNPI